MIAVSAYLVAVDPPNRDLGALEITHEIEVLPVTGRIIAAPQDDQVGEQIVFQWNALLEAPMIGEHHIIEPEFVYRIGEYTVNDWLFMEPKEETDGFVLGKVISHPFGAIGSLYPIGQPYLYEKTKAHRIETHGFNTLNPSGLPISAIKYWDLLVNLL